MSNREMKNHKIAETKEQLLLGYIPFDSEKELEMITKITDLDLKKDALKAYKKELFEQKIGIARLMSDLEKKMLESPDLEVDKFKEIVRIKAPELKLTQSQLDYFDRVINRFSKQHQLVKKTQEEGLSALEIYHQKVGQWPEGEIEISYSPITINLQFHNLKDYTFFVYGETTAEALKEAKTEWANFLRWGKPEIGLIAINPNNTLSEVVSHEEMHALKRLFDQSFNIEDQRQYKKQLDRAMELNDVPEVKKKLSLYFKCEVNDYLNELAGEILAFYRESTGLSEIKENINKKYLSQNIKEIKKNLKNWQKQMGEYKYLMNEVEKEVDQLLKEKTKELYKAIEILEKNNYSRQEIIALLATEPSDKWLKWARRLTH